MRSLVSFLGGAASVGIVVGVLSVAGVIDDDGAQSPSAAATPSSPAATAPPVSANPTNVSEVYRRVSPGVVFIEATSGASGNPSLGQQGGAQGATGSGFVYDAQGHIVTNDHVVEGFTTFSVRIGKDAKPLPAKLVGKDPSSDLAVLLVEPSTVPGGLQPLQLGDSNAIQPGDQAIAIGSPFGLEGTVTEGIVSSLGRTITAPNNFPIANAVQTDAAINPGNSGGPLLDAQGRVIGVNSQIKTGSGENSGVGFAVPVSTVKTVVPQIKSGGKIKRAYLGVSNGNSRDRSGAVVQGIEPGGPAAKAGLQAGDKITSIDNKPILTSDDVSNIVGALKPGQRAEIAVVRGNERRTLTVEFGTRPDRPTTR